MPQRYSVFWLENDISENSSPSYNVLDAKHVFPENKETEQEFECWERRSDAVLTHTNWIQNSKSAFLFSNWSHDSIKYGYTGVITAGVQFSLRVALHDHSLNLFHTQARFWQTNHL